MRTWRDRRRPSNDNKINMIFCNAGVTSKTQRGKCCSETYPTALPTVCHCPPRPLSLLPCRIYSQPAPPVHYPTSRFLSGSTCTESQTNTKNKIHHSQINAVALLCEKVSEFFSCHLLLDRILQKLTRKMADGRTWCKVCSPFGPVMMVTSPFIWQFVIFESLMAAAEKWVNCRSVLKIYLLLLWCRLLFAVL